MMTDKIEKLDTGALIQHGKHNDRIYVMDIGNSKILKSIRQFESLAKAENYGKIFAKVPAWAQEKFEKQGYKNEATVPRFYRGKIAGCFMAKFFDPHRVENKKSLETRETIGLAKSKAGSPEKIIAPKDLKVIKLNEKDADNLAELYGKVFKSYPFPIQSSKYILKTMDEDVDYFGIYKGKKLVAASSAEKYPLYSNVEMTDFATDPDFRGEGFALYLLNEMEEEMEKQKIFTWYTIARSLSPGMNITFAKLGYKFAGTLVNNTNICGNLENMNVWYKNILPKRRSLF